MSRIRQLAAPAVVVAAVLFGAVMGFYIRPGVKQRTDPSWPTEAPTRITISYPNESGTGHKVHILNVIDCTKGLSESPPGNEWRIQMNVGGSVWLLKADPVSETDG